MTAVANAIGTNENPTNTSERQPPRVLHVIPAFQMGGAERMLVNLFHELDRPSVVEMRLCSFHVPSYFYPEFRPRRDTVVLGFHGSWRALRPARRCIRQLRVLIDAYRPDVVHTHLWLAHFYTALALRGSKIPLLCHIHNTWDWLSRHSVGSAVRRKLFRWAMDRSDAHFIACSEAARSYWNRHLGIPDSAFEVIRYGIDTDRFRPSAACVSDNGITFGSAGRYVPEKGHEVAFRAVREMLNQEVSVQLRLAGAGPCESDYRREIERLDTGRNVALVGQVDDMPGYLNSIDVFVQPSRSAEGLPLTILEAMSCGLPIIATDVAGAREAVRDGVEGRIIPPGNPQALAAAMTELAGDDQMRRRMGQASRERAVAEFPRTLMAERVLKCYQGLSGAKGG